MLQFKKVTLEDKDVLTPFTESQTHRTCDLSFVNMYAWSGAYNTSFAIKDDTLFIRVGYDEKNYAFLSPVGGDFVTAVNTLIDYTNAISIPLKFSAVPKNVYEQLNEHFPDRFEFIENRDSCDYLYETELLATYRGKKLHAKKNHVNRFNATYEWRAEPITRENIDDCFLLQSLWCAENDCAGKDKEKTDEQRRNNPA